MAKRKTSRQKRVSQTNHPAKSKAVEVVEQAPVEQKSEELKAVKATKPIEVPHELSKFVEMIAEDKEPEETETVEEIKEPQYLDKFWFGSVFIPGIGVVSGRVRDDHLKMFKNRFEAGQSRLPKADRLTLKIDYWIRDTDELDKKLKEGKKDKN